MKIAAKEPTEWPVRNRAIFHAATALCVFSFDQLLLVLYQYFLHPTALRLVTLEALIAPTVGCLSIR